MAGWKEFPVCKDKSLAVLLYSKPNKNKGRQTDIKQKCLSLKLVDCIKCGIKLQNSLSHLAYLSSFLMAHIIQVIKRSTLMSKVDFSYLEVVFYLSK